MSSPSGTPGAPGTPTPGSPPAPGSPAPTPGSPAPGNRSPAAPGSPAPTPGSPGPGNRTPQGPSPGAPTPGAPSPGAPTPGAPSPEPPSLGGTPAPGGTPGPSPPKSPLMECPDCEVNETNADFNACALLDKSQAGRPDVANTEFVYYSSTLREVAPRLTSDVDRQAVIPWLRKLFRPEYHTSRFRCKRNKFLLYLCLTLMNDEVYGVFKNIPPKGALPDFETICREKVPLAEWEQDSMWKDVLQGVPSKCAKMKCSIHTENPGLCGQDIAQGDLLDDEFAFLLYLARPYAILLTRGEDRTKVASWFQTLCTIQPSACSGMKRIRNDYLTALLGYLHELRVSGPFSELPNWDPLPTLSEAARIISGKVPLDPCRNDADEFFASQPMPDEGAFCYFAVTGELLDNTIHEMN